MRDIRKEYSPTAGPRGASTAEDLKYWSERASAHSDQPKRARSGEMRLPNTGGPIKLHSTNEPPRRKR